MHSVAAAAPAAARRLATLCSQDRPGHLIPEQGRRPSVPGACIRRFLSRVAIRLHLMRCQNLGKMLRDIRRTQGLSQRSLAIRAGTSQDAISRIERGVEAPTLERFEQLLLAMGQRLVLDVEPLESPVPAEELAVSAQLTSAERLREAVGWNRLASQLAIAGEQAREEGHPATRRRRE